MAVPTINSLGEDSGSNVTTLDITVTVAAETDDALLALIPFADGSGSTATISSVVLDPGGGDEAAFTFSDQNSTSISAYERVEAWYLLNPPVGTFTVRITASEELSRLFGEISQAFPVNQTDPYGATGTGSGTGTSFTASVTTTAADSAVLGILYSNAGDSDLVPDDETELMDRVQTGTNGWAGHEPAATTGSYTISVTSDNSGAWNLMAIELLAAEAGEVGDLNVRVWRANPEHTSPEVEVA